MQIAAVQFDIVWEDKAANHRLIKSMLEEAGVPSGALVVLPELGDTGFSFDLDAIVDDRSLAWARELAASRCIWLQAGYAVRAPDGRGRNRATLIGPDGAVIGHYDKIHPFSIGRELESFDGGDRLFVGCCDELRLAPLICYDLRFPELWRLAALAGAELFAIGASWPAARQQHWRALMIARAIENLAWVVGVNRVGQDPNVAYAGGSIIVSPRGEVVAEANDEACVLQATIDAGDVRHWRGRFPALRDVRPELLGTIETDVDRRAPDDG